MLRDLEPFGQYVDDYGVWPTRAVIFLITTALFSFPFYLKARNDFTPARGASLISAAVTAVQPQSNYVQYEFQLSDSTYTGEGIAPAAAPRIGDSITVAYLPSTPTVSRPLHSRARGWWVLPFIGGPLCGAVLAFSLVRGPPRSAA